MNPPYTVDNEKYHALIFHQLEMAKKGLLSPREIKPLDGLVKRAAQAFKSHQKMPANRRPRFPAVVTSDTLYSYRHELYRRGLLE